MSCVTYEWHADAWTRAQAAIQRGAHALLVAGASGLGKGQLALDLAAAYLCASHASGGKACGACVSCHWLAAGTHPDFTLIQRPAEDEERESNATTSALARERPIGVDQIRVLSDLLSLSAHRDAGKVVIIRPAEALNAAAANALLKSLEEPPSGVLFLLVSDRPASLLPTVRSRCQTVGVGLRDPGIARAWLEGQGVNEAELPLALAGGAPLQAAAIASDPVWQRRRGFLAALASRASEPLQLAEAYRDLPPALMLGWLQRWTYDLLLMRFCSRVRYHIDLQDEIVRAAATVIPIRIARLHRTLISFQRHVNHPLNARNFIEHMLLEYARALAGQPAV